jgi:muconolactone delta-isomerase
VCPQGTEKALSQPREAGGPLHEVATRTRRWVNYSIFVLRSKENGVRGLALDCCISSRRATITTNINVLQIIK